MKKPKPPKPAAKRSQSPVILPVTPERGLWGIFKKLSAIGGVLALLLTMLHFWPEISIEPTLPAEPANPFSGIFKITNEQGYPLTNVGVEVSLRWDFDAELKALGEKARDLKSRKVQQLGELVMATGADALSANELAGALIMLAETKDTARKEAWAKRGAAFFQSRPRRTAPAVERNTGGARAQPGGAQPSAGSKGAA